MHPTAETLNRKKRTRAEDPPNTSPPPKKWVCRRCRSEIDDGSAICRVHEGLYVFYHPGCVTSADLSDP